MAVLGEKEKEHLRKAFEKLSGDVTIVLFTQEFECELCAATRGLLEEVAALSGRIKLRVHDFVKDAARAAEHKVDKIPAILLIGDRDTGIRFYGAPAGYEFPTLIEDIVDVSRRDPGLPAPVLELLKKVDAPVHMQAIVSPT